jgi:hypothetical protein
MKQLLPFAIAALIALPAAGCATAPETMQVAAAQAAGDTCRQLVPPGSEEPQVLCGSTEEWTEFDRRVALIDAGVTCRSASETPALAASRRLGPSELCMTGEQWAELDRRVRGQAGAGTSMDEGRDNAAQIGFAQAANQAQLQVMSPPVQ